MATWKPEPDREPYQINKGKHRSPACVECGKKIRYGNVTGLCRACWSDIYGDERRQEYKRFAHQIVKYRQQVPKEREVHAV